MQRERAYHDALRDLATPAMGHPPLLRIAAPDGDGAAAYAASATRCSPQRFLAAGRRSSLTTTLIVLQTPQRTRTFFVM